MFSEEKDAEEIPNEGARSNGRPLKVLMKA